MRDSMAEEHDEWLGSIAIARVAAMIRETTHELCGRLVVIESSVASQTSEGFACDRAEQGGGKIGA